MTRAVTLLTPSYHKDIERFTLQRESIERCGIELPHVAIVHHEDLDLFKKVPFQRNLRILSTQDVFTPRFERRRLAWGKPRRDFRHWGGRPGIHGWFSQQLVKLASPMVVETEGIICIDSDTLFVDTVTSEDFYGPDGRLHFYETDDDVDCEMGEWYCRSLRFLGESLRNRPVLRTTHSPVPLHRQVVLNMQAHIEKQHGVFWMEAMARAEMIMEYSTYGAYARYLDKLQHVVPARPDQLCLYYWWREDRKDLFADLVERVQATKSRAVVVQSSQQRSVSEYRALIEKAWGLLGH